MDPSKKQNKKKVYTSDQYDFFKKKKLYLVYLILNIESSSV